MKNTIVHLIPLVILVFAGMPHAQSGGFHTSPLCWDSPRIFHSGEPSSDYASKIDLVELSDQDPIVVGLAKTPDQVSPNDAYRLWENQPDTDLPPSWQQTLVVDVELGRWHALKFEGVAGPINLRWISEKLLYLRVIWGRVVFQDIVWDVEKNILVYNELAQDGRIAHEQFKASCGDQCSCEAVWTKADLPESFPDKNESIGLLVLPGIYGPGETGGPIPSQNPQPVSVYANPGTSSDVVAVARLPAHFESAEYGYEAGAAVVFEKQDDWLRVALKGLSANSGWIASTATNRFLSLNDLLPGKLAYLNTAWKGVVYNVSSAPASSQQSEVYKREPVAREYPVNIYQVRKTQSGVWLQLAFYLNAPCEGGDNSLSEKVWVPAYNAVGKRTAWFWSRGC